MDQEDLPRPMWLWEHLPEDIRRIVTASENDPGAPYSGEAFIVEYGYQVEGTRAKGFETSLGFDYYAAPTDVPFFVPGEIHELNGVPVRITKWEVEYP